MISQCKDFENDFENFCNIQQLGTNNVEIVYRDYWKNVITKNKIYFSRKNPAKIYVMMHIYPNYCICIKKLRVINSHIMRVEILNLNFSIKGIKNKSCFSSIYLGLI